MEKEKMAMRSNLTQGRKFGAFRLFVIVVFLFVFAQIGCAAKMLEIREFTLSPEVPAAGSNVTLRVKAVDPAGIKGIRLKAGRFKKLKDCAGETECTMEFTRRIPHTSAGKLKIMVTVASLTGAEAVAEKTIVLGKGRQESSCAGISCDNQNKYIKCGQNGRGDDDISAGINSPMGVAFGPTYRGECFAPLIKELGIKRIHVNFNWGRLEPRAGTYDWRLLDKFVGQLPPGTKALIRVRALSKWAVKGTVPKDLESYGRFVRALVERTGGKVRYFENDWEADFSKHWSGTSVQYVKALQVFYKAVKDANPNALVIAGGHSGLFKQGRPHREDFITYVLENGHRYFDLFDLHLYGPLYSIPNRVGWFRNKMKELGYEKPIVVTEYGGPLPKVGKKERTQLKETIKKDPRIFFEGLKGYPENYRLFAMNIPDALEKKRDQMQGREMLQRTVLALSSGVEMTFWWNLRLHKGEVKGYRLIHPVFGKLSLMEEGLKRKRPAFYTFRRIVRNLGDVKHIKMLPAQKDDILVFKVTGAEGTVKYVLWHKVDPFNGDTAPPVRYTFTAGWKRVRSLGIFGNAEEFTSEKGKIVLEVSGTPMFLEKIE